jgi:uracil-DNA glycosylase family 4
VKVGRDEELLKDLLEHSRFLAGLCPLEGLAAARGAGATRLRQTDGSTKELSARSEHAVVAPAASPARQKDQSGSGMPGSTGQSLGDLEVVRSLIGDCQRCRLAEGRKSIVFGQGDPKARLMFVGEAPGAEEDEQGLAFVGRAGQLLTDIIEKGLRIPRREVFIANVIKCRPPGNRNPETDEILACQPFLEEQIRVIRPKVLVGLGKFAGHWLLKTAEPISKLRGRVGSYQGIHVMPTYHPAYLLRNPAAKRDVWEDMKVVLALLAE